MASRRMRRTKNFASYLNALNTQVADVTARNEITSISAGAITGDSLAENVTLFGSAIQSTDYVSGYTGWKIDGTGVAEFSDVYVRGDINAETGTIGYWNISSPGVTRTIGDRVLLGTFLESSDLGSSDDGVSSGVYVGLFKSYFEDASPVTSKIRTSNLATVSIPNNPYQPGDQVYITLTDDTSFNNGGLPVTVLSSTSETITYYNVGSDFPTYSGGVPTTTAITNGEASLYNPDVAGLYIKDYGKAALDYGYFSNQGVAYVSASRVNLVHNPSFEMDYVSAVSNISGNGTTVTYTGTNNFMAGQTVTITDSDVTAYNLTDATIASANSTAFTVTSTATGTGNTVANAVSRMPSTSAWTFGNSASNTVVSVFRYSNLATNLIYMLQSSTFAAYNSWSASALSSSRYFRGTINYSKGVDYHVFDLDKVLYLKYDAHISFSSLYSATFSSATASSGNVTITTTTAHGFSVGDLVALDFKLYDPVSGYEYGYADVNTYPDYYYVDAGTSIGIVEVTARTNTTFSYTASTLSNPTGSLVTVENDDPVLGTRPAKIHKTPFYSIDLSQINFEFSNGQTVPISNVVNDMTTAAWASSSANKYMSLNPLLWFMETQVSKYGIPPLQEVSTVPLMVDSNKLRLEYSSKDATGYAAKSNITLNLPSIVYRQQANALTGTYTSSNVMYMTSNVAISSISGNGTTVTYSTSAGNNFAVGDRVTITGASTAAYNLSNVAIAGANTTSFTVTSTATGTSSTATANGYRTSTLYIDNVSFSTEPIPFFGDTSSDYSWEDGTLNSSNQISVQTTKHWLDINLDDQTGSVSNLDYLGFKQSRLNNPLLSQPSISTSSDYSSDIGLYYYPFSDYENLKISSGVSSTLSLSGDSYNNLESRVNLSTSKVKSVAQIIASFDDVVNVSDAAKVTATVDINSDSIVEVDATTFKVLSASAIMSDVTTLYVNALNTNGTNTTMSFGSDIQVVGAATFDSDVAILGNVTSDITSTANIYTTGVISHTGKSGTATTQDAGVYLSPNGYAITSRSNGIPLYVHRYGTTGTADFITFVYNGSTSAGTGGGSIRTSSGGTPAFAAASDYRIKENITPVIDALERMKKAKAYTFNKTGSSDIQTGFLAHELAEVLPDAVDGEKDAVDGSGEPIYQIVMEAKLIPVMAQAIHELVDKVESLTARLEALEG